MTASSSNQALIPNANIVLGGSGANRTVTVTPVANANGGPATITLTVSDGVSSATETFNVTVTRVNDPPTISDIGDQSTSEDTSTPAIAFTVFDLETTPAGLVVTASSSNPSRYPSRTLRWGGLRESDDHIGSAGESAGIATIVVTVTDAENASAAATFVLTVGSEDDPPVISGVADVTIDEDTSTGPLAFVLSDPDTGVTSLTVTAARATRP